VSREDWVALSDISPGVLETVRGREILCNTFLPDLDANPESINLDPLIAQLPATDKLISSNSLPKLEPAVAAEVLLGVMLLGVQRYGNRKAGYSRLGNDVIVAAMVRDTLGLTDKYSAVMPGNCEKIELSTITELFGENVTAQMLSINSHHAEFLEAHANGETNKLKPGGTYANVIAAIEASKLRLVARAAGDDILRNLDAAKKKEVRAKGIDCYSEMPELEWLQIHYDRTKAALALDGVDYGALREPLEHTLMNAVADSLEQPEKRRRLVGRRGKAVYEVHNSLPLIESFNATENLNSLATLHIAALEMMHYLEKGRRKSSSTMLGHSLRIAAVAERIFGEALEPSVATTAILHDIVEDGSRPIAGYDQSLNKIKRRFGGPMAAMVAELTDAEDSIAAQRKAKATLEWDTLILPQEQYNFDRFTEMKLQPTPTHEPYTLAGIITKIIDTAISEEEGIRDPDVMTSWWRHSGIRIYWSYHVRGSIVRPLLVKLTQEIERYEVNPDNGSHILNDDLVGGLKALLAFSINSSDHYAVQNLAILSHEYGLTPVERNFLIDTFFNESINQIEFHKLVVEELLVEDRLKRNIQSGSVPAECYVALYAKSSGKLPEPDADTFVKYRAAAIQRATIVKRLGLEDQSSTGLRGNLDDVVLLYDLLNAA